MMFFFSESNTISNFPDFPHRDHSKTAKIHNTRSKPCHKDHEYRDAGF